MPRMRVTVPFTDKETGRVRLIGHAFDCSDERAQELAELGLAEAADGAQEWPPKGDPPSGQPFNLVGELVGDAPEDGGEDAPETEPAEDADLDEMTREQLVARCEELGVEYPAKANKAKLKQLIEQAEAGE